MTINGDPDCPVDGNLALRALAVVRGTWAADAPPLRLRLTKRIPMGAGLGGDCSKADAAWCIAAQPGNRYLFVKPKSAATAPNNLAVLHALRGDDKSAGEILQQALATSPTQQVLRASIVNNLGVLAEMRGDRRAAERHYADALGALAFAPSADDERRAIETNLARIRGLR